MEQPVYQRTLRQPPPRSIDLLSRATILFGGLLNIIGWSLLLFMSMMFWTIGIQSEAVYWFRPAAAEYRPGPASVEQVKPTNFSENDRLVYAFDYRYTVDGRAFSGTAYDVAAALSPGQPVEVYYDPANPDDSYLPGLRRKPFSSWLLPFLAAFALPGLVLIAIQTRRNARFLRLLQNGAFTRGRLLHKKPTNTRINRRTVYRYTFGFEHKGRTFEATGSTHHYERLEDEESEIILYDPHQPTANVVYDAQSNAPRIDGRGQLQPRRGGAWVLLLPLGVVVLNVLLALY